jgi:prephenate dehydrogenase
MQNVAIVGTGLIGASFGLALRKAGFEGGIVGVSSPPVLAAALARGAIDCGAPLAEAVGAADLVFLSQAIGRILDTIRHLEPLVKPGALVTDAGSTKCEIVDLARQVLTRCQFLGGHPMAGKESRGAAAADAELFYGHPWALTPDDPQELETAAARDFRHWLQRIGARVAVLDCDAHDRLVARTSHVPQLASTALAAVLEEQGPGAIPPLSGPGLKDMTRLALSSYDLWRDILATNSDHIGRALGDYIQELEHLRENLRTRQLQEEFTKGAAFARRLREPQKQGGQA